MVQGSFPGTPSSGVHQVGSFETLNRISIGRKVIGSAITRQHASSPHRHFTGAAAGRCAALRTVAIAFAVVRDFE
jgi:hypothetical protein